MPIGLTLDDMAEALATGDLTPASLVDGALNDARAAGSAFIDIFDGAARADAEAATARRRAGRPRGRFDGIPFAVKDLIDVAGSVTTAGSRTRTGAQPAVADAPVVARLRRHGLIPIGKTNLSEFAFSGLGLNPHFGTPTARERPDRVPGGSSSGSAVAVADGVVAIALGTDTAGSIRLPSAFNGLAGYRPSVGRYDSTGVFPLAASFDVPGPMAGTVADCLALDAMMGGAPWPRSGDDPPALLLDEGLLGDGELDPVNRSIVLGFAGRAAAAGARVEARPVAAIRKAADAIRGIGWLGGVEAAALHRARLSGPERGLMDPRVAARLDRGAGMPPGDVETLGRLRRELAGEIDAELGDAVLLTPASLIRPPLLAPLASDDALFARTNVQALFVTMIGSFLGMPGFAVPVGNAVDGLPASVLLSAPAGGDARLLAAAAWTSRI